MHSSAIALNFGKKEYATLGKLLAQKEPEVANRLIICYLPGSRSQETDFSKLHVFFNSFCHIQQIEPEKYKGPLYKSSKIDQRRLFISALLQIYDPRPRGLINSISKTLNQHQSATTRMIAQVEFQYKHYDEFKCKVDEVVEKIKEGG